MTGCDGCESLCEKGSTCSCQGLLATPLSPNGNCGCCVCECVRLLDKEFENVERDPDASVKVGVGIPGWLRERLPWDLLPALRARLTAAAVSRLKGRNVNSEWCLSKGPKIVPACDESERYMIELNCLTQFCERPNAKRSNKRRKLASQPPPHDASLQFNYNLSWRSVPIFYEGQYVKASRQVAQTKWINNDYHSIEQLLAAEVSPAHLPTGSTNLIGWGREDVDVCMFGEGRKFLLQIHNPRQYAPKTEGTLLLRDGAIVIQNLHQLPVPNSFAAAAAVVKSFVQSGEVKLKVYGFTIRTTGPVANCDEISNKYGRWDVDPAGVIDIEQRTPTRVVHRRANIVRPRRIYSFHIGLLQNDNDHRYICRLVGSAGLYIKEFVHGDFGRTQPCLKDILGVEGADLLQLDVLNLLQVADIENPFPDDEA